MDVLIFWRKEKLILKVGLNLEYMDEKKILSEKVCLLACLLSLEQFISIVSVALCQRE